MQSRAGADATAAARRRSLFLHRSRAWLASPQPFLLIAGFGTLLGFWYLAVEVWKLPRFEKMPGITQVVGEWLAKEPAYGLSIYVPEYYNHIWASVRRVLIAFGLATVLGVPLGLLLGWSKRFKDYVFAVFELLRPIPALAWVPLAIVMFTGSESAVVFITFLPAFFATTLNSMLGAQSTDAAYSRAAASLGARRSQIFWHIVVPGAMPFIFTGLQIAMGVGWFSLVAGEMIAGEFGLGYVIYNGYTLVTYPTIVIGMITLGIVGYISSVAVRLTGRMLMQWRARDLGLDNP